MRIPANERLRYWRAIKGWPIRKLASEAGMSPSKIHRLETGDGHLRTDDLAILCTALGIDEITFYGGEARAS